MIVIRPRVLRPLLVSSALAFIGGSLSVGCGDDDGPASETDAGQMTPDAGEPDDTSDDAGDADASADAGDGEDASAPDDDEDAGDAPSGDDSGMDDIDDAEVGEIAIEVDSDLEPNLDRVSRGDDVEASVSRMLGEEDTLTDFIDGELLIFSNDESTVEDVVERYDGEIVSSTDFSELGLEDIPVFYRVTIDVSDVDADELLSEIAEETPEADTAFGVSSDAGKRLLAVALRESLRHEMTVSPNWLLETHGIAEGSTQEALDDGSFEDAYSWNYMTRGSTQDIGVGDAWRALLAADRLDNRVTMLIFDGGFAPSVDFPEERSIVGGISWNQRNPGGCSGGNECPWHGTHVVTAAAGQIDDSYGAAGTGGPVVDLVAMQAPANDAGAWLEFLAIGAARTLVEATAAGPSIMNISASFELDIGWEILSAFFGPPIGVVMSGVTASLRASGLLIVASAGNAGKDVDNDGADIEGSLTIPCELSQVICVGGIGWNSTALAQRTNDDGDVIKLSNFGSKGDDDSVDIYAPYTVFTGPDPDDPEDLTIKTISGTSFSSPFVAGVAALVWAADPSLNASEVWQIIRDTANSGAEIHDRGGRQIWVDAYAAVLEALDGDAPPYVRVDAPTDGSAGPWHRPASFSATAYDVDGDGLDVTWTSNVDGEFGSGSSPFTFDDLSIGLHTITATATAGGQSASDSVEFTLENSPPNITLVEPTNGADYCTTDSVRFLATVTDVNNPSSFPFPTTGVVWRSTPAEVVGDGAEHVQTLAAGDYTVTATAVDEVGAEDSASVDISVAACENGRPNVVISEPPSAGGGGAADFEQDITGSDANGDYIDVTLIGSATDPEDGALTGDSLVWTTDKGDVQPGGVSSGEQAIGTGTTVTVRLYSSCELDYFGTVNHVITLTATDSGNPGGTPQSRSVTRIIRVKTLC